MKPAPFEYFAPTDITEALDLLARYGDEAKILAGGQSLMPLMNMRLARPRVLVDINRLPALSQIALGADGTLSIGALTRQRAVERATLVQTQYPLLAAVMPCIGHFQIRNRGTIGGSIVHADPAAELPAVCLALEAEFVLRSTAGQRTMNAADFFRSYLTTAIDAVELLVDIRFPPWQAQWCWGFQEVCRREGDFALVGAVAVLRMDHEAVCQAARLTMFGVGGVPFRPRRAEDLLSGQRLEGRLLEQLAHVVAAELEPDSDIHASAEYRREVGGTVARRAVEMARGRAGGETTNDDSAADDSVDSER
jgi:carbon-monoxide dehydrogenase medium subunit